MTAPVEWIGALRYALLTVSRSKFSFWRKLQIAFLKVVAVCGYHYGKLIALRNLRSSGHGDGKLATEDDLDGSGRRGHKHPRNGNTDGAGASLCVAVVIPIYASKPECLVQLLTAIEHLSLQRRLPDLLVLVDDGSPLPLPRALGNDKVQILRMDCNRGPAAARNAGLARAQLHGADLVCFLDADCVPSYEWVAVMEAAQKQAPGITCGRTLATAPDTAIGVYHDICGTLNGRIMKDGSMLYGCTCNLSVNLRSVPLKFDESFSAASFEDVDFCVRARKQGIPLTYSRDAVVRHQYNTGIFGLFWQFVRYGLFEPKMAAKHKEYLPWLWSSEEISSLTDLSLPQGEAASKSGILATIAADLSTNHGSNTYNLRNGTRQKRA